MKKLFTVLAVLLVATALFAQVGLTVKAGGAFGFASNKSVAEGTDNDGNTLKFEEIMVDKAMILKSKGFGFDVGAQYDITDKLLAYADFNMVFSKDVKINFPDTDMVLALTYSGAPEEVLKKYVNENGLFKVYSLQGLITDLGEYVEDFKDNAKVSVKYSFFSVSAGVAYKLDFDAVKLNVGGGVTLNKATAKFNMEFDEEKEVATANYTTIGLNAMVEAKYMVADNIGVGVTLMPQVGLYNKAVLEVSQTYGEGTVEGTVTAKGFAVNFAMPIVVGVSYTF